MRRFFGIMTIVLLSGMASESAYAQKVEADIQVDSDLEADARQANAQADVNAAAKSGEQTTKPAQQAPAQQTNSNTDSKQNKRNLEASESPKTNAERTGREEENVEKMERLNQEQAKASSKYDSKQINEPNRQQRSTWNQGNDRFNSQRQDRSNRYEVRKGYEVSDRERTADWRLVRHNGNWWYRTPMNTWMVHRGGEWNAYNQGHHNHAGENHNLHHHSQEHYSSTEARQQFKVEQSKYQGEDSHQSNKQPYDRNIQRTGYSDQPRAEGQKQWMCIDGRMRRVTVRSANSQSYNKAEQANYSSKNSPTPAGSEKGEYKSSNQSKSNDLSPPVVPEKGKASGDNLKEAPKAPSMDVLRSQTQNSAKVNKPVLSDRNNERPASPSDLDQVDDFPRVASDALTTGAINTDTLSEDTLGGPSEGLNEYDSLGGDTAPERR